MDSSSRTSQWMIQLWDEFSDVVLDPRVVWKDFQERNGFKSFCDLDCSLYVAYIFPPEEEVSEITPSIASAPVAGKISKCSIILRYNKIIKSLKNIGTPCINVLNICRLCRSDSHRFPFLVGCFASVSPGCGLSPSMGGVMSSKLPPVGDKDLRTVGDTRFTGNFAGILMANDVWAEGPGWEFGHVVLNSASSFGRH